MVYVMGRDSSLGAVIIWKTAVALLCFEEITLALLHSLVSAVHHCEWRLLFAWTASRVERQGSVVK